MHPRMIMAAACLAVCAGGAQAELYKWTGPDGKTVYSDRPPPVAVPVERPRIAVPGSSGVSLPYELSQAASSHPVVLYTTNQCPPCETARKLLLDRGIPFAEKTVTTVEDSSRLRKLADGDGQLPIMTVGRAVQAGFEAGAWTTTLDSAGYPKTSRLPRGYANPPVQPLAMPAADADGNPQAAAADKPGPSAAARPAPVTSTAPPRQRAGFQF